MYRFHDVHHVRDMAGFCAPVLRYWKQRCIENHLDVSYYKSIRVRNYSLSVQPEGNSLRQNFRWIEWPTFNLFVLSFPPPPCRQLYIILIRPERNVRQSMMPTRYSTTKSSAVTATNASSMIAPVALTAATCDQNKAVKKHITTTIDCSTQSECEYPSSLVKYCDDWKGKEKKSLVWYLKKVWDIQKLKIIIYVYYIFDLNIFVIYSKD